MKILLLSDIHANFPALKACIKYFSDISFDAICNSGDSLVYGPFPNKTLHWLQKNNVYSIVGNTDKKIISLLQGKSFKKPRKAEKRIMYSWTFDQLHSVSKQYLLSLKQSLSFSAANYSVSLFHGSPEHPNEFLFPDTSVRRFEELASICNSDIIITGHSHIPYHKLIGNTHFINPGSIGRMFDSNPDASCAVLTILKQTVSVQHYRISWPINKTLHALNKNQLPEIYQSMYISGRKLN